MQRQVVPFIMRVMVEVVDTVGIEQRTPTFNTMYCIAFTQQQFREVSAVLSGDARNQCSLLAQNLIPL
ncbi:hypothetical protein D3C78_1600830 [compost metagenome]